MPQADAQRLFEPMGSEVLPASSRLMIRPWLFRAFAGSNLAEELGRKHG